MRRPQILTRAGAALQVFRHGYPVSRLPIDIKKSPFIWPDWRKEQPQWQIINYQAYVEEGFNLNAIVYEAIMYKVRAIMQAPLRAYRGDPDSPKPAPETSPLSQLIFRPNPNQSFVDLQSQNVVYLNLAGNVYIFMDRPKRDELPIAMYSLRPDRVYIIPDRKKGNTILGYQYVPEGKAIRDGVPILPQDMMHIKLPNPGDPLEGMGYGLSPLSAMARTVDVDNAITHFLKLFFDKGVMVPGILSTDQALNEKLVARIRERWKQLFGGYKQWSEEIGVLERGLTYQRVGLTFDEMGFDALDERNESRILGPFGVAPILVGTRVGLKHATYSNYEQARQATWEDTLVPELKLFETSYQYYLQYRNQWVQFDISRVPALIEAAKQKRDEADRAYEKAAITKNEYRVVLGYPAMPGGDVFKISFNTVFIPAGVEEVLEVETPAPVEAVEDEEEREEPKQLKSPYLDIQKINFQKATDNQAVQWEDPFADAAEQAFMNDLRRILALVSEAKAKALQNKQTPNWAETLTDIVEYLRNQANDNWREEFIPVLSGLMTERGEYLNTQFGIQFDVRNLLAEEWFDLYTIKFAQTINDSTEKTIREVMQQGMNEGWSIEQTSNHLETLFTQWMKGNLSSSDFEWFQQRMPPHRRELIARTETISASNIGSFELYRAWGAPFKEWVATLDDRVRETHSNTNGQVKKIDEPFQVNGTEMMYPGDKDAPVQEVANCRCTLVPVFDGAIPVAVEGPMAAEVF